MAEFYGEIAQYGSLGATGTHRRVPLPPRYRAGGDGVRLQHQALVPISLDASTRRERRLDARLRAADDELRRRGAGRGRT